MTQHMTQLMTRHTTLSHLSLSPPSGLCAWPGSEGQCLALSSLLRRPQLDCALIQNLPSSAAYQAAFSTCTAQGDRLLVLLFTQLMPLALPNANDPSSSTAAALSSESPPFASSVAVCQVMVRSGSAEAIRSIQISNGSWIQDLSSGTVLGAVGNGGGFTSGLGPHAGGRPKPPMDPRLMELHASFVAHGQTGHLAKEGARGVRAGLTWVKGTALCEWQRLAACIEV